MLFPPDPDSLVEKLKLVHLQCYIWVNALKATLNVLWIESETELEWSTNVV